MRDVFDSHCITCGQIFPIGLLATSSVTADAVPPSPQGEGKREEADAVPPSPQGEGKREEADAVPPSPQGEGKRESALRGRKGAA